MNEMNVEKSHKSVYVQCFSLIPKLLKKTQPGYLSKFRCPEVCITNQISEHFT